MALTVSNTVYFMLSQIHIAWFLTTWLVVFFSLNLFNLLRTSSERALRKDVDAEVKRPWGSLSVLAAFGTLFFFLESCAYPFLVATGLHQIFEGFPLQIRFEHVVWIRVVGVLLESLGYTLFLWSVLERGRYATSWEMREDHKLVTWGPYHYVRHPSYLGYFLMFSGLFFVLLNLLALIPIIAIPGYIRLTIYEEQLLTTRFGDVYREYQKKTGRFLPRIGSNKKYTC